MNEPEPFDFDTILGDELAAGAERQRQEEKRIRYGVAYGACMEHDLIFARHSDEWIEVLKNRFGPTGMLSPDRFAVFYRMAQRPLEVATRQSVEEILRETTWPPYAHGL